MICPPPKRFKPAGELLWAEFSPTAPDFSKKKRRTGRRRQGMLYEKKGHGHLTDLYGERYVPSPWLRFTDTISDRARWCQPDGLLIEPERGVITLVEFKYQHTSDAWWQLRQLYEPVVGFLFPHDRWELRVCEVVKWYDPATLFPERVRMIPEIHSLQSSKEFGVHIWKP